MHDILGVIDYQNLQQEFETIGTVQVQAGDKLAVFQGKLVVTKGGWLQGPARTILNMIYGGYNRDAVVAHLEQMKEKTAVISKKIFEDPDFARHNHVILKEFEGKMQDATLRILDIGFVYADIHARLSGDRTCKKFSALYGHFHTMDRALKRHLATIVSPPPLANEKEPLEQTPPIDFRKIELDLSPPQTPEKTLALAKHAQEYARTHAVPLWKKVSFIALSVFSTVVLFETLFTLTVFKWYVWNPVEYALKGKVTTQNPLLYWVNTCHNYYISLFNGEKNAQHAAKAYTRQLANAADISDPATKAFVSSMAGPLGSQNIDALWAFSDRKLSEDYHKKAWGPLARETVEEVVATSKLTTIEGFNFSFFLLRHFFQLEWIDNPDELIRICNLPDKQENKTWLKNKNFLEKFEKVAGKTYPNTPEGRKKFFLDWIRENAIFEREVMKGVRLEWPYSLLSSSSFDTL